MSRIPIDTLRAIGFSQRKAEYVLGLADKFSRGDLSDQLLREASDAEVTEKLIAVRGLGKWSVDMFALFTLKRLDVFSAGDLGVQRGMAAFAGRNVSKLRNKTGKFKYMTEQEMQDMAEPCPVPVIVHVVYVASRGNGYLCLGITYQTMCPESARSIRSQTHS